MNSKSLKFTFEACTFCIDQIFLLPTSKNKQIKIPELKFQNGVGLI